MWWDECGSVMGWMVDDRSQKGHTLIPLPSVHHSPPCMAYTGCTMQRRLQLARSISTKPITVY